MKIAYFTDTFLPQINGVVSSLATLAGALGKKGYKIVIFAPKPARGREVHWKSENVEIQFLPSVKTFIYHDFRAAVPISPKLLKIIRQKNPDIIHFQTTFFLGGGGILLGKLLKKPVVGSFHGYFMEPEYLKIVKLDYQVKIISNILWKYVGLFYNQCDAVLTYSQDALKDLKHHKIKKPIFVVPNSIDTKIIKKVDESDLAKLRKKYKLNKKVIINVGRLSPEKSLEILMKSFVNVVKNEKNVTLFLVGDGPSKNSLINLSRSLKIERNVVFTGNIPQEDLLTKGYLQLADVFATASTSELQPISIIEAIYFGLPLVGVAKRGTREMIQGVGLLSQPEDPKSLAQNILKVISDKNVHDQLSKNSRQEYERKYKLKKVVSAYESFYEEILEGYKQKKLKRL